nr:Ras-related protein RABE1c [Tanacetum cinerariifolium]
MGILLVYDVTDESSFNNIRNWIRNIEQHASDNVNKILVGNKADMDESKRAVPTAKGQALADEYGIKFFESIQPQMIKINQPDQGAGSSQGVAVARIDGIALTSGLWPSCRSFVIRIRARRSLNQVSREVKWEMYAIGWSGNPTLKSQGDRCRWLWFDYVTAKWQVVWSSTS